MWGSLRLTSCVCTVLQVSEWEYAEILQFLIHQQVRLQAPFDTVLDHGVLPSPKNLGSFPRAERKSHGA